MPGYQAIADGQVAIKPELHMLRNSTELPLVRVVHREGDTEVRSYVGEYQAETLFSWVGNHPLLIEWQPMGRNQSLRKDIRGYRSQIRSSTQEYLESLRALELVGNRTRTSGPLNYLEPYGWPIIVGNYCSLRLVCWTTDQLYPQDTKTNCSWLQRTVHVVRGNRPQASR